MNISKPDLKIKLSPGQRLLIDGWLKSFLTKFKIRMSDPFFDGSHLNINSIDLINFLSMIRFSELDFHRLRAAGTEAMATARNRKKNLRVIEHYRRCEAIMTKLDFSDVK